MRDFQGKTDWYHSATLTVGQSAQISIEQYTRKNYKMLNGKLITDIQEVLQAVRFGTITVVME